MRRIVITGMGVVSPLGCNLDIFWDRMRGGWSGVRRIQGFDASMFNSQIAGEVREYDVDAYVGVKEQRRMDKFSRYAVGAAKMAMADSGDVADHPYQAQFQSFFDAIDQGEDMARTSMKEALESFRVVFACDKSAKEGRPVKLSEFV